MKFRIKLRKKLNVITYVIFAVTSLSAGIFTYLYFDIPQLKTPNEEEIQIVFNEDMHWDQTSIELTAILTDLLQIQTVRKDELKAALYLQRIFQKEGISAKIIPHPKRPDKAAVVAEIGPEESEEGIILLSHLDVVEVNPEEWSVPPFAAVMKDSRIYGRGALDMKGMAAMELMTFLLLHRSNFPLKNKLMFLAVPDEESGGELGAKFLLEEHLDLFEGYQYVINEGGFGIKDFPFSGNELFTIQTSEKGIINAEIISKSNSGHGSMPEKKYSSLSLMKVMMELQTLQKFKLIPQTVEFFHHMSQFYPAPQDFFLQRIANPFIQYFLGPLLQKNRATNALVTNTISITGLETDSKSPNVIPAESRAILDIRTLPGEDPQKVISDLTTLAKKFDSEVIIHKVTASSESTHQTELYDVLFAVLKDNFPNAEVSPYLSPGGTDSRYFREKGFVCYGMIPVLIPMEDVNRLHGKDESISLENLTRGTKILFETIVGFNQIQNN